MRMKEYLKNKSAGFYLTVVATILALIGIVNYYSASGALNIVKILVFAVVAVEMLLILLSYVKGNQEVFDLAASVCAILMASAIILGFTNQMNPLGFFAVGMYSLSDVLSFLMFAGFGIVSMVLFIIASFLKLGKQKS